MLAKDSCNISNTPFCTIDFHLILLTNNAEYWGDNLWMVNHFVSNFPCIGYLHTQAGSERSTQPASSRIK